MNQQLSSTSTRRVSARRFPVGAELQPDGTVSVRVWAPAHRRVAVVLDGQETHLEPDADGYFSAAVAGRAGSRYGFRLDGRAELLPDPASRSQPGGVHDLSEVVNPDAYVWHDHDWPGITSRRQVIYQLHVGTFTEAGTWRAAREHLTELRDLGITVVQMMPVAAFPGKFGWGYDGVCWFAPTHLYGTPDDLRAFVDHAHAAGLAVILDVVYNHLGPDGNYLGQFSADYFSTRYESEWGEALNYDGPNSGPVRDFVLSNVAYWIAEFHMDGFRLDATQQIFDASEEHLITAIARTAREAAGTRGVLIVGENEPQEAQLVRDPENGGCGLDIVYNDDFHHTARVRLTGIREAYYTDYSGSGQEILSAVRYGFLYQGQYYPWQKKARGTPALDVPLWKFLYFLENHDQVANSAAGLRLASTTAPGLLRAMTALLLLSPGTPLLFQGQERGCTRPFLYFADHREPLASAVRQGRHGFLKQFPRLASPDAAAALADPASRETFAACILDRTETPQSSQWLALYRDLIRLRREDPALGRPDAARPEGALLSPDAFVLRFIDADAGDRLLAVNLGAEIQFAGLAEPLIAPPPGRAWHIAWSSEAIAYGGAGTPQFDPASWRLPGQAAMLLAPAAREEAAR